MQNTKKTVNIITCHDVYNLGASLQAYALRTYLSQLGHDAKTIDYKPPYLSGHYKLWGLDNPRYDKPFVKTAYHLAKLPSRLIARCSQRKKAFDAFTKQYLTLTKRYTSNEALQNDPPIADVYLAGSDQIWNTLFQNGKDPAFYLDFAPKGSVKASYAASFATKDIAPELRSQVKAWLCGLDCISVREQSGADLLERMGIEQAQVVLDPVFLLTSEAWDTLAQAWHNPENKPYILLYDFEENPQMYAFAKELADKNGWKIVSVLKNKFVKKNYEKEGPCAFVSLVKHAQAVVSNSFHATAFSVIYQKDFWIFDRAEGINTRMHDLVTLLHCGKRDPAENRDHIDYIAVGKALQKELQQSKAYIDTVLSMKK
jgi:hypothetical protein